MTSYRYEAARDDGAVVAGDIEAQSAGAASAAVAARGLFPIAIDPVPRRPRRRAAARRELAVCFRGIAVLVAAGVPVERAVASVEPVARGALRVALARTRSALAEGRSLGAALAAADGVIPDVVLGIVRAGERGSQLSHALEEAAAHLEHEADLAARVRQAVAYPLLLAVSGTVSVLVIGAVVVPRFATLLGDLGQTLPLSTQLLVDGGALLERWWLTLLLAVGAGLWAAGTWAQTPAGRARLHAIALQTPVVGPLRLALASSRVSRALGAMLGAGMPLLVALDAAADAAGDAAVAARLARSRERVAGGATLSGALAHEAAITPTAVQLVAVGEASGRLADMTRRAGDLAAQQAERELKTLVSLLEPALIVAFGGLVAFVAAGLLQAVYAVRPGGF